MAALYWRVAEKEAIDCLLEPSIMPHTRWRWVGLRNNSHPSAHFLCPLLYSEASQPSSCSESSRSEWRNLTTTCAATSPELHLPPYLSKRGHGEGLQDPGKTLYQKRRGWVVNAALSATLPLATLWSPLWPLSTCVTLGKFLNLCDLI